MRRIAGIFARLGSLLLTAGLTAQLAAHTATAILPPALGRGLEAATRASQLALGFAVAGVACLLPLLFLAVRARLRPTD